MDEPLTLTFEVFWSWLLGHPNCILRAGTPEAVVYDDEDLHWHFASEGPQTLVVQVIRGKHLVGEILVEPERVSYIQGDGGERDDEYLFELVSETESERIVSYFFVLSHGYDLEEEEEAAHPHTRVH